jgi:hypothetical protein
VYLLHGVRAPRARAKRLQRARPERGVVGVAAAQIARVVERDEREALRGRSGAFRVRARERLERARGMPARHRLDLVQQQARSERRRRRVRGVSPLELAVGRGDAEKSHARRAFLLGRELRQEPARPHAAQVGLGSLRPSSPDATGRGLAVPRPPPLVRVARVRLEQGVLHRVSRTAGERHRTETRTESIITSG